MAKFEYSIRSKDESSQGISSAKNGLKNLEDGMRNVNKVAQILMGAGAIGGVVAGLRKLYQGASEAEAAFAKLHPEMANAAGSLAQWNKATEGLKAAMGGLISSAISPVRENLSLMIGSLTEAINKTNDLSAALTLLSVSKSPEAAKYLAEITAAQAALAGLRDSRGYAAVSASGGTGSLIGAARGATTSAIKPLEDMAKATKEWDDKLKTAQAKLDKLVADALAFLTPKATGTTGNAGTTTNPLVVKSVESGPRLEAAQEFMDTMDYIYGAVTRGVGGGGVGGPARASGAYVNPMPGYDAEGEKLIDMPNYAVGAMGPLQELMGAIGPLIGQFQSISMLLNPWQTILQAMLDALQPMVDELLQPLIGALVIIGQTMAAIIAPVLQILAPVIKFLADAFVFLYNKAVVPIANVFITLFKVLTAFGQILFYLVTFQWGKLSGVTVDTSSGLLSPISTDTLGSAGAATLGGPGSTSTYSTGRDITVNVVVNSEVITGEGGFRELALMLNREIENAIALGVA